MTVENKPTVTKKSFGKTPDGTQADIFTLTNAGGAEVRISNYGGVIVSVKVPDRNGEFDDVVLGYDTLDGYLNDRFFIGALIGPFGNRINKGKFSLNGTEIQLAQNRGGNHLHGGEIGFNKRVWDAEEFSDENGAGVRLKYLSKDGEENYPGNLSVTVTYTLTEENELKIDYSAETDKDTIVNFTNHSYFNLGGKNADDILGHMLHINGDHFLPTDETSIPTGEVRSVKDTPMDFTQPAKIGARIESDDAQLKLAAGYDQNWVLNKAGGELSLAARAYEPGSGRVMEVFTTEPGMQFYSGNRVEDMNGKDGRIHQKRSAFCLETQHYPDSPNHPHFPTTVLKPGEKFHSTTIYKFSTSDSA
jgi:aldose 1-epimerase